MRCDIKKPTRDAVPKVNRFGRLTRRRFLQLSACSTGLLVSTGPGLAGCTVGTVATKPKRIGIAMPESEEPLEQSFLTQLADLGWVEGRTIVVDRRYFGG